MIRTQEKPLDSGKPVEDFESVSEVNSVQIGGQSSDSVQALDGIHGKDVQLLVVGTEPPIAALGQSHHYCRPVVNVLEVFVRVSAKVQTSCHSSEGSTRSPPYPAIGSLAFERTLDMGRLLVSSVSPEKTNVVKPGCKKRSAL